MNPRRWWPALLIALALAPSAWLAWEWRELQHLGIYHDDSIYWVAAKSLASGSGYRIESLPDQPYQTKYPPLYPALLSLVWRLNPAFPDNLKLAMLLNWLMLPLMLLAARVFYKDYGFDRRLAWAFCALVALNPIVVNLSVMLMTEVMFGALVLAAMIVAERALKPERPPWLALAAGAIAGLAFLTRSSALPLLVSGPVCFLWRRQGRRAALFLAGMAPAVAGWQIWAWWHMPASRDMATMYYTNYLGFHLANVGQGAMPEIAWLNAGALAFGLSELLVFSDSITFWSQQLARMLAAAGIVGTIRLARRRGVIQYPLFAGLFAAQAVLWHYPPHNRFVLPVLPLLLAGFWTEMEHLTGIIRKSFSKPKIADRIAAGMAAAGMAALALLAGYRTWHGLTVFLPSVLQHHRSVYLGNRQSYEWLAKNSPPGARVFAYSDPLMYLYTGRQGISMRIPPKLLYKADPRGISDYVESLPEFVRRYGLNYVLFTAADFQFDSRETGMATLKRILKEHPGFQLAYQTPSAAVYRVEELVSERGADPQVRAGPPGPAPGRTGASGAGEGARPTYSTIAWCSPDI